MLVELYCRLMEVYEAHVITWKQLWICRSAFDNSMTGGDDKQQSGHPSMSTVDDNVCLQGPLWERTDTVLTSPDS